MRWLPFDVMLVGEDEEIDRFARCLQRVERLQRGQIFDIGDLHQDRESNARTVPDEGEARPEGFGRLDDGRPSGSPELIANSWSVHPRLRRLPAAVAHDTGCEF